MLIQSGVFNFTETHAVEVRVGNISTFANVIFPTPFPKGEVPIVIPFVQTFGGPQTPGIRIAEVTNVGFKFRLNELAGQVGGSTTALSDGKHLPETIGWIAISPNSNTSVK